MKKLISLIKIEFFNSWTNFSTNKKSLLKYLGILFLIVYMAGLGYMVSKEAFLFLSKTNETALLINGILLIGTLITILRVATVVINDATGNEDFKKYSLTFPFSSKERYLSKIFSIILSSYSIFLILLFVPLIYYGIAIKASAIYYFKGLIVAILLPILIVVLFHFIIQGIVLLFTNLIGKKATRKLLNIVYIVGFFLYIIAASTANGNNGTNFMLRIARDFNTKGLYLYPRTLAKIILNQNSLLNFIYVFAFILGVLILATYTVGRYYENFLKVSDYSRFERKKIKNQNIKYSRSNNKYLSYIKADLNFFMQNPTIAFNTVLLPLIIPFVFILSFQAQYKKELKKAKDNPYIYVYESKKDIIQSGHKSSEKELCKIKLKDEDKLISCLKNDKISAKDKLSIIEGYDEGLQFLESKSFIDAIKPRATFKKEFLFKEFNLNKEEQKLFKEPSDFFLDNQKYFLFIPVFVAFSLTLFGTISGFMISKDKDSRSFYKTIPIGYYKQYWWKKSLGFLVKIFISIVYFIVLEAILKVNLFSFGFFYLGFIQMLLIINLFETIELVSDIIKPNYNWNTTIELVKRSPKTFILNLGKMLFVFLLLLFHFKIILKSSLSYEQTVLIYSLIIIVLNFIIEGTIYKKRNTLFKNV